MNYRGYEDIKWVTLNFDVIDTITLEMYNISFNKYIRNIKTKEQIFLKIFDLLIDTIKYINTTINYNKYSIIIYITKLYLEYISFHNYFNDMNINKKYKILFIEFVKNKIPLNIDNIVFSGINDALLNSYDKDIIKYMNNNNISMDDYYLCLKEHYNNHNSNAKYSGDIHNNEGNCCISCENNTEFLSCGHQMCNKCLYNTSKSNDNIHPQCPFCQELVYCNIFTLKPYFNKYVYRCIYLKKPVPLKKLCKI